MARNGPRPLWPLPCPLPRIENLASLGPSAEAGLNGRSLSREGDGSCLSLDAGEEALPEERGSELGKIEEAVRPVASGIWVSENRWVAVLAASPTAI